MNLETRKLNLINWISSIQEEDVVKEMERLQQSKNDWWNDVDETDKKAIRDGIDQLDNGSYMTRSQVRSEIRNKYNF